MAKPRNSRALKSACDQALANHQQRVEAARQRRRARAYRDMHAAKRSGEAVPAVIVERMRAGIPRHDAEVDDAELAKGLQELNRGRGRYKSPCGHRAWTRAFGCPYHTCRWHRAVTCGVRGCRYAPKQTRANGRETVGPQESRATVNRARLPLSEGERTTNATRRNPQGERGRESRS